MSAGGPTRAAVEGDQHSIYGRKLPRGLRGHLNGGDEVACHGRVVRPGSPIGCLSSVALLLLSRVELDRMRMCVALALP